MKKRRILSIIVSIVAIVSMAAALSACGSGGSDSPAPAGSASSGGSAAASGSVTPAGGSDLANIQAAGTIVVGVTDFAPMDYQENGKWVGFDAELSEKFAESLGVDVEFVEIDWDNKILELDAGAIDCVWNGMTLTPEVDAAMSCTNTYAINAQVIVMPADKMAEYPDVASMSDLSFAVEAGSAGESVGNDEGLSVNAVQNQAAALMEVAAGTSDACIIDKTMADAMIGEGTSYPDLAYAVSLSEEEYVVGFRNGSDLTEKLNELFKEWTEDGTMKALAEKYDNAVSLVE